MQENERNIEMAGAGASLTHKNPPQARLKRRFTAKRIALMAIFVALAYTVSFWEIPMPILGASFLKLDFGSVFILLMSFLLGPIEGVLVCLLKEGLRCITSDTQYAGEIANFLITSAYLLLPSIFYQYRKSLGTVIVTISVSCLIATGVALFANRFIIFPYFFKGGAGAMFSEFWLALLIFNLIKTAAVAILTILLYKRLSNFLKKWKI